MSTLRFDDRVVIVTGAGNGLGRSHAIDFASRGAKVVVNDLGGGTSGGGRDASAAQAVVDLIKKNGGEAVANADSVEDGAKIVQCALDTYGRIDVVVNNAGILRDAAFHKMSDEDWDLIMRVHLNGAYRVTRAAWPHLRDQGYGRVVLTASGAGIYGNFGQANYSTAKLGLHGFGQTLSIEGASKGIRVNTIAPLAASRLTQNIMPAPILEALAPELVSPLVVYLAHESCDANGQLIEVGGGWIAAVAWERSPGVALGPKFPLSAEVVAEKWAQITDFSNPEHPRVVADTNAALARSLSASM